MRKEGVPAAQPSERLYRVRFRVYASLLIFVIGIGTPMIIVPALRSRLISRTYAIKQALLVGPEKSKPVTAQVGENSTPFPEEFARPQKSVPQNLPRPTALNPVYQTGTTYRPAKPLPKEGNPPADSEARQAVPEALPGDSAAEPDYRTGKVEQEAYDLLLRSNETVLKMVQGSDPALRFTGWGVAKREEDVFWVRLTFMQSPQDVEAQYIWQIKLQSKQIAPLNYNARSITKP